MSDIFINMDENTTSEDLEKIIKYNIGKASIMRDHIKELERVELAKKNYTPKNTPLNETTELEEVEPIEEEYLYYYYNMKNELTTATDHRQVVEAISNTLPSCENKNYSNIVNRIKLELLREINELDIMLSEEEIKNDTYFTSEINNEKEKIHEVIEAINYLQTTEKEVQVEKAITTNNNLIFLTTPTGSIYAENDLYSIPEEYYESFRELLISIKNGTLKNVKMLNSSNQSVCGISEVKDFKTRIVFDRISSDTYVIISAFTKKCDINSIYIESLANRTSSYRNSKQYLKEMCNDEAFIKENNAIYDRLIKNLEDKNLVKTIKDGNNNGK